MLAVLDLKIVLPSFIISSSGAKIFHEPAVSADPELVPLFLNGRNPRTYFYDGLIGFLDGHRPDIILLENDPVSRLGLMIVFWCRKNERKLICQSYENIRRDIRSTLFSKKWAALPKNSIIHVLNHYLAKKIDAILVVNKESEALFRRYGYISVVRIPLGYDHRVFFKDDLLKQQFRRQLQIPDGTVVVAYFGRMVPQKGVHLLIQALAQLKSSSWMLMLDHAFDQQDSYNSYIQTLIERYGLLGRVVYFEADHFEIANYMRASDVMVAPSLTTHDYKEQYGRTVQEAMACGCICIVSDSGHLPDLVGDPSLVFREDNVGMICDKLLLFITNESARSTYSSILAERAKTNLTTVQQAVGLKQLIGKLVVESIQVSK